MLASCSNYIVPLLLLFISGCISSKKTVYLGCSEKIEGSKILVMPLDGFSDTQSDGIFGSLKGIFIKNGIQPLFYYHEEWNFASKNIKAGQEGFLRKLSNEGIQYIMIIEVLGTKEAQITFNYSTPYEVHHREKMLRHGYVSELDDQMTRAVDLLYTIVSTETGFAIYQSKFSFEKNAVAISDEDEGEYSVNPGSARSLFSSGIRKGLRKSLKSCETH